MFFRSEWPFLLLIICLPSVLLTAVTSTLSYTTPGLLMDTPSVKTGQQICIIYYYYYYSTTTTTSATITATDNNNNNSSSSNTCCCCY